MRRFVARLRNGIVAVAWSIAYAGCAAQSGTVAVIGHSNVGRIDAQTLARIYTGRVIEVDSVSVTAVNARRGSELRNRFLADYLQQDEQKYTAYWVVRRYVGKGTPPPELPTDDAVIAFVRATPGAIGYVDRSRVPSGVNVLLR